MPFATNSNDGVRIYYEVEGSGPPLVLLNGGSSTMQRPRDCRYDIGLRDDFQLILFDGRGLGKSDRPESSDHHRFQRHVGDVLAILDDLGIERAHFFGYSLGGMVAFRLVIHAPERVLSIIVGGAHPFEARAFWKSLLEDLEDGVDRAAVMAYHDEPGIEHELENTDIPILVFVGREDTLADIGRRGQEGAKHIPNATLIVFNGLDHRTAYERSDLTVPHMRAFLERIEAESRPGAPTPDSSESRNHPITSPTS